MNLIDLSIILPCYNEEKRIENTLNKLLVFLRKQKWTAEIIIANDGSTDRTSEISINIFEYNQWTSYLIVEHQPNKGRGAILKKAFREATGTFVMYLDADLATDLVHLNDMLDAFQSGHQVVTGSRLLKKSITKRPIFRELLSQSYNLLVRFFFWDGIRDHQCGFKGIEAKVIPILLSVIESTGWFWDTETLIIAKKRYGLRVKEIPVVWTEYRMKGESKVKILDTVTSYLVNIIWLKKKLLNS